MRTKATGWALTAVAVLGVASLPRAVSKSGVAAEERSRPAAPATPKGSAHEINPPGPAAVLCQHFTNSKSCDLNALPKIRAFIATVPDPQRTDLRLSFDRSLDSLLWAAADSKYSFEARWLPWSATAGEAGQSAAKQISAGGPDDAQSLNPSLSPAEAAPKPQPGILLFHGSSWNDVLAIFLVGESVTGGLERRTFQGAVQYIAQVADNSESKQTPAAAKQSLWIVGPTFSGSFESLTQALQTTSGGWQVHIVSGTATNSAALNKFTEDPRNKAVDFGATVENDAFAVHAFLDYLHERWKVNEEIAVLAEDQTTYGRLADDLPHAETQKHGSWLFMRFPYGISRLRNTYEQENAAATVTNEKAQPAASAPPQTLNFNLASPDEKDLIPAFSAVQSPLSEEAVLLSISSSLQREQVGYVGIVATDILDAVFLTRFLRRSCPDVRIFILDSDLLFARAELNTALQGVLSITTYPLFGRNQHWTALEQKGVAPRRTAFASRYAEGEYNAAREQLFRMNLLTGKQREVLLDYRRPDMRSPEETRPPLWLTVLGKDGYWPLALLDTQRFKTEPKKEHSSLVSGPAVPVADEELHPDPASHAWLLLFALLVSFALLHSCYVWFVYLYPVCPLQPSEQQSFSRTFANAWNAFSRFLYLLLPWYPRATSPSAANPMVQENRCSEARACPRFLLVLTLILALTQIVLAASGVPFILREGINKSAGAYFLFFAPLFCLALLLAAARSLFACPGLHRPLGLVALSGFGVFSFLWCLPFLFYKSDNQRVFFFTYRMSHPISGVSPATPVLLLLGALFAWGFMLVSRRASVSPPAIPNLDNLSALAQRITKHLEKAAPWRSLVLAFIVILSWGLLFRGITRLRSVETDSYDLLILLLLALNCGLIFACWAQLLDVWKSFRSFLQALERHPLRKAFSKLPKEISTLPLFQKDRQKIDLFTSARCKSVLDAFIAEMDSNAFTRRISGHAELIRYWMSAAENQVALCLRDDPQAYAQVSNLSHQLERTVLRAADDLLPWANKNYWQYGDSDSIESGEKASDLPRGPEGRQRILAEEFIALRFVMYIRHALRQMRSLLWFIVIGFVLTVLSLSAYPFQSNRFITVSCLGFFVILGVGFVSVFAQMDRDAVLSRLSESRPEEIGKSFYLRLASFGALPLLTVLATQFPSLSQFLSSWVQPALEAFR